MQSVILLRRWRYVFRFNMKAWKIFLIAGALLLLTENPLTSAFTIKENNSLGERYQIIGGPESKGEWGLFALLLFCSFCWGWIYRVFKKWLRQWQRHKSMIWLVEWGKIIVLHVRHAFWCNFLTQAAKRRREIFIFEILTTTWIRSSKCFVVCRCMKIIRAKEQAKVLFAYFVQRDQLEITTKYLTWRRILF